MDQKIERVDSIPLILYWLKEMHVRENIDRFFIPHSNWSGLSYGQLTVLFLTYVIYNLNHRLSPMEEWVNQHRNVLEQITGWNIGHKDATDDRLGRMLEVFGEHIERIIEFQIHSGQYLINAYQLPTEITRYDTTSFSVYHQNSGSNGGLFQFGHNSQKA